jgi:hypothetical protein
MNALSLLVNMGAICLQFTKALAAPDSVNTQRR